MYAQLQLEILAMQIATIINAVACFSLVSTIGAAELAASDLSADDSAAVAGRLKAFEQGKLSLEELTEASGKKGCEELVAYYMAHTNAVPVKYKLPISRCLGVLDRFSECAKL